ncbi:murein biosynthesis integral membrane protein MurJ [Moritella viscosa]|uniref:Probable lipid II flippase MurJ n=1 Tax=Moritella viscosa TaxID=80854 RepID=A0A090K443_9GAMM|nr:murein biosynthesis integral membrane protein MurJ [Moritella viscosa]CED58498.1 virulence factor MviN homolog [Moritella viscosa]SGY82101.1 Virulence factor MviN [Moritella viscosa]SGY82354.1 Virulence factor MviN [Moritella viscosa]SGY82527.1 Virulence factor MviN [Moritella viscosa]SGY82679.1 Virulence factor MviN [Moritella viscosa]
MSNKLIKSGLIVSSMTMISRILGLVRDVIVANLMGAGAAADVFFFANKIPNFLRRLFAEGAFAQAFVPVLTEYQQTGDKQKVRQLIASVSGTLGVLVTIVTLFGVIGSPLITILFGAGWFVDWLNNGPDAHKFELASFMLKITFPYLWFITFTALSGAILNTLGKFAVAAFTPVFLNIAIIGAALFIAPNLAQPEIGLAIGVFIGGAIQFLFQIPFLAKQNMLVKPRWGWRDPGVTKIRKLMIPAMFGVSVSQINLLFDTFIASFLMTGSISWLYYSDRLLEFPLGLFGIAIATVILPALSRTHSARSDNQFKQTMDWGVRVVLLLGTPAMMGMIVLASPMLKVLFMRGEFGADDVSMASMSLMAYGSGLLSFMLIKVLAPGYYARQDTRTPVKFGIIAMISNMGFNIILAIPFGYVGLALATAGSATLNASLLYWGLHKEGVYKINRDTGIVVVKLFASAGLMAALVQYAKPDMQQWYEWGLLDSSLCLLGLIGLAVISYFMALLVFGLRLQHFKITD